MVTLTEINNYLFIYKRPDQINNHNIIYYNNQKKIITIMVHRDVATSEINVRVLLWRYERRASSFFSKPRPGNLQ